MVFLFEKPSICMFVRELVGGDNNFEPYCILDDHHCFMDFYGVELPTSLVFLLDITHHVPSFHGKDPCDAFEKPPAGHLCALLRAGGGRVRNWCADDLWR